MKTPPRLYAWVFADASALKESVALHQFAECELLPVSTCQRHELFILASAPLTPPADVVRMYESADAALHLFEITAGVLSDVPGEEAVAMQMKIAIRTALRARVAGTTMAKLVHRALRAGDTLRKRVRETAPIVELPELLPPLIAGRIILLGAGSLGRSVQQALTACGFAPAIWATRTPRAGAHTTITHAVEQLREGDTLIAALPCIERPIEIAVEGVHVIDLSDSASVCFARCNPRHGNALALGDVIEHSRDRLAPQADAVKRAAHRLTALAEAALAECICPSIKSLNRAISAFRTNIVEAELARLAPVLANLDPSQAEIVKRSIQHAAARSAHPLHEYVNALGRQGRADDARLLIDHILGSRVGIQTGPSGGTGVLQVSEGEKSA